MGTLATLIEMLGDGTSCNFAMSENGENGENRGVWYTIYHPLPFVKGFTGFNKPLYESTKKWEKDIFHRL